MPEYPKQETVTLGSGLPEVHSINGFELQQRGWKSLGNSVYEKDGVHLKYDGVYWNWNGQRVQFFEDILNDKK